MITTTVCAVCDETIDEADDSAMEDPVEGRPMHRECWAQLCRDHEACEACGGAAPRRASLCRSCAARA